MLRQLLFVLAALQFARARYVDIIGHGTYNANAGGD